MKIPQNKCGSEVCVLYINQHYFQMSEEGCLVFSTCTATAMQHFVCHVQKVANYYHIYCYVECNDSMPTMLYTIHEYTTEPNWKLYSVHLK